MNWTLIFIMVWIAPMAYILATEKIGRETIADLAKHTFTLLLSKDDWRIIGIFVLAFVLGWLVSIPILLARWISRPLTCDKQ